MDESDTNYKYLALKNVGDVAGKIELKSLWMSKPSEEENVHTIVFS